MLKGQSRSAMDLAGTRISVYINMAKQVRIVNNPYCSTLLLRFPGQISHIVNKADHWLSESYFLLIHTSSRLVLNSYMLHPPMF